MRVSGDFYGMAVFPKQSLGTSAITSIVSFWTYPPPPSWCAASKLIWNGDPVPDTRGRASLPGEEGKRKKLKGESRNSVADTEPRPRRFALR